MFINPVLCALFVHLIISQMAHTVDSYCMGHDWSFGVLVWNNETPYLYLHFGVLRKTRTGIYCRIGHFSRGFH